MNSKKLVAMGLALILALSLCACAANEPAGTTEGETTASTVIADSNNDGQIEVGTVEDVEVNEASISTPQRPPPPATGKRFSFPSRSRAAP